MIKEWVLAGIFLVGLTSAQQYWPSRQYWPQWRPRYSAGQPVPNYNGFSRNGYGYNGNGGSTYQGTIWRSGWIPAKNIRVPLSGITNNYPGFSADKTFTDYEARNYVERFFPNLLDHDNQGQNPYQTQSSANQRPNYSNYRPPYHHPQQHDPNEDPSSFPEVIATCEQKYCYLSCRLGLMGGGRCTKAGCMCYMAFFDSDGSPTSNFYPEDNIWYELSEKEREDIREAIRKGQITSGPPTARPPYPQQTTRPTSRPTYRPPTAYTTTTTTRSTARPPYRPTTTTKKPNDDSDFFGGDNDDDDDDDDVDDDFGLK